MSQIILSRAEAKAILSAKPKRSKYGAKKTIVDGITFDSRREAERWVELRTMERAGLITHLSRQQRFDFVINGKPVRYRPSGRQIYYKADFIYFSQERNARVVEDVKGFATKEFQIKRALVEAMYPGVIIEVVK